MRIAVGSTNGLKIGAVQDALLHLGIHPNTVVGCDVPSGVNEQPFGLDEATKGALNRAKEASRIHPDMTSIGIESCVTEVPGAWVDIAVIVIITPDGRRFTATSSGVEFPDECVRATGTRGFRKTRVGSVIAKQLGGESHDPHRTLTKGRVPRGQTLIEGIRNAFAQMLSST